LAGRVLAGVLTDWELDPPIAGGLAIATALYLAGVRRARRWPARRTAAFLAGLALLAVALESGLQRHGDELLSVHMAQHLILMLGVPPLLLLGQPLVLALRTLPSRWRDALALVVRGRAARVVVHPAVALGVFAAVVVATHVPAFYEAALRSDALHGAEHSAYLWASLLLWTPVLGVAPMPRPPSPLMRLLVLLSTMPPMALIGVVLMSRDNVVYPSYGAGAARWGVSALADQQVAAALMWVGGSLALIAITVGVAGVALRREEARAVARESYERRRAAHGGIAP
jgi:putative membrane protein